VCLDTNGNATCDPDEAATTTDGSGRYSLPGTGSGVVADIPAGATQYEPDTFGATTVSSRIVLRAPKESTAVISVHTTSVVSEMETAALAYGDALQKVAATLGVSAAKVMGDFNQEPDAASKQALKSASAAGLRRIQLALAHAKPGEDPRTLLASATGTLDRIRNVVVIYLENRSFDNLYGLFPGANGIANALASPSTYQQRDRDGVTVLPRLPAVWSGPPADWAFVASLPNKPFRIDAANGPTPGKGLNVATPDVVHRFYNMQMQIDGGRNDQYVAWSDNGGLTMGYYDGSPMQLWKLAQQYTLADNFYQAAFGGSFLNHVWLVCACSPGWAAPPASRIAVVDGSGTRLVTAGGSPSSALTGSPVYQGDLNVTPMLADGRHYAVNATQPPYQPSGTAPTPGGDPRLADSAGAGDPARIPLPPQTATTIGDTLSAKNLDWKWYAGAWNQALADRAVIENAAAGNFQPTHQPFNYFRRFDPTTAAGAAERAAHLKDYADLLADIQAGTLPPVAFYKPQGTYNQHAGYTTVAAGDAHVAELIAALAASRQWPGMLIVVTYDESGGWWDHAAPPKADLWGPGARIPALVVSPFAKRGYVDSVPYDTTSIINLLTRRFGLAPLAGARQNLGDLSNALDLRR
jgi:acid phosphatase